MYEGQINRANYGEPCESEVLRQFRWTDLVARLAATRDLREEMERQGEGDFSAFASARRMREKGKPPINHDALSDGKAAIVNLDAAATGAVHGDRENK